MRALMLIPVVSALLFGGRFASAAEPVKSGIQPGEPITTIFSPLNVTGPFAGERHCMVCENGANPVAMVFAREPGDSVARLLAKLDAATIQHRDQEMGSFVVFLSEQDGLEDRLNELAKRNKLEHLVLTIDSPPGPEGFFVSGEADVTVVLYRDHKVLANHAFRAGELNDRAISRILADVPKIVSSEK